MRAYFGPLMARLGETVGRPTGLHRRRSGRRRVAAHDHRCAVCPARERRPRPHRRLHGRPPTLGDGRQPQPGYAVLGGTISLPAWSLCLPVAGNAAGRSPRRSPGQWPPCPRGVGLRQRRSRSTALKNGEHLTPSTYGGGRSSLIFTNDIPQDVALKLRDTDGARAARAFVYIRTGEQVTLEGVRPVSYQVQVASGSSWDSDAKVFGRGLVIFQFEEAIEFEEIVSETVVRWWDRSLRLYRTGEANEGVTADRRRCRSNRSSLMNATLALAAPQADPEHTTH